MGWRLSRRAMIGAAGLLLLAVACGLMWRDDALDAKQGTAASPAGSPAARPGDSAAWPAPAADAAQAASSGSASANTADPHTQFMQAVKAAREKPLPPPPPAIAKAKSFPEAFAAMQAAQREAEAKNPPPGTAALNPFAPATKSP